MARETRPGSLATVSTTMLPEEVQGESRGQDQGGQDEHDGLGRGVGAREAGAMRAIGRSPQEGRRRKASLEAVEKVMKVLGAGFDAERNGRIIDIMKYDTVRGHWAQKPGRGASIGRRS